jgi:hypothetical protein
MRISKEYQNAKCDYGSEESLADTETFAVRVPKLNSNYSNPEHGISGGDMHFQRDDLKVFFDAQITKLFDMMDKQLVRLQQKYPSEQVAHLVLSGGLGNSAYVQSRLRSKYAFGNTSHSNARSMQIRVAPDPQLVVCKGNVADRVQKLKNGQSVLGWRCCRASYGTKCKMLYNPKNPQHIGQRTEIDILDKKTYIVDCVDWFIKKGEPVSSEFPIVRPFSRKCPPATRTQPDPARIFPTAVVSSDTDAELLPYVMNSACQLLCAIESSFESIPLDAFKLKNRHWWNMGSKYHRINFNIKVNLGPADLSFELWHEGVKLSKDNAIKVEWQAAAAPSPDTNGNMNGRDELLGNGLSTGVGVRRKDVGDLKAEAGLAGAWEAKGAMRTDVVPASRNGSTVW